MTRRDWMREALALAKQARVPVVTCDRRKLDAMSPLKVLSRGYAMAQKETGELIRSVKQTTTGESIVVSLADGKLNASILSIKEASHESENQDL